MSNERSFNVGCVHCVCFFKYVVFILNNDCSSVDAHLGCSCLAACVFKYVFLFFKCAVYFPAACTCLLSNCICTENDCFKRIFGIVLKPVFWPQYLIPKTSELACHMMTVNHHWKCGPQTGSLWQHVSTPCLPMTMLRVQLDVRVNEGSLTAAMNAYAFLAVHLYGLNQLSLWQHTV